jgi:hypothetical protein
MRCSIASQPRAVFGLPHLPPDSPESLHLRIEAMKLAFADVYRHAADPAHMRVASNDLLDPACLHQRAARIDRALAQDFVASVPPRSDTVYLAPPIRAATGRRSGVSGERSNRRGIKTQRTAGSRNTQLPSSRQATFSLVSAS